MWAQARALDVEEHRAFREGGSDTVELTLGQSSREELDVTSGESLLGSLHGRLQRTGALAVEVKLDRRVAN